MTAVRYVSSALTRLQHNLVPVSICVCAVVFFATSVLGQTAYTAGKTFDLSFKGGKNGAGHDSELRCSAALPLCGGRARSAFPRRSERPRLAHGVDVEAHGSGADYKAQGREQEAIALLEGSLANAAKTGLDPIVKG